MSPMADGKAHRGCGARSVKPVTQPVPPPSHAAAGAVDTGSHCGRPGRSATMSDAGAGALGAPMPAKAAGCTVMPRTHAAASGLDAGPPRNRVAREVLGRPRGLSAEVAMKLAEALLGRRAAEGRVGNSPGGCWCHIAQQPIETGDDLTGWESDGLAAEWSLRGLLSRTQVG